MTLSQTILATATASEELPDSWHWIALIAFVSAAVLSVLLLVASFLVRRRVPWFAPLALFALLAGSLALGFWAYVYKIDYVAVGYDGTKASPPIWQAFSVPSLPVLATLTALVIYRARNNKTLSSSF